jgi:hypothetical protein
MELFERGMVKLAVSAELAAVAPFMPSPAAALAVYGLAGAVGQYGTLQAIVGFPEGDNRGGGQTRPTETVRPPAPRPGPLIPIPIPEF